MIRDLMMRHRALAVWLVALALFMKVVIPSGYMVSLAKGVFSVELCSGYESPSPMAMPAAGHHPGSNDHGNAETPCAFACLAAPSLAGADPLLLAAAVLFILCMVVRGGSDRQRAGPGLYLRPPLRGPPPTLLT